MAASPNLPPWFETACCARLLTMRPSVVQVSIAKNLKRPQLLSMNGVTGPGER
jgi:hypothetical protein